MKAMLLGFSLIIATAILSSFALNSMGFTSQEAQSGSAVRLDG